MPIPLIIDTDPGVDDVLAILLALASPEVEIKAITINFGNTDIESSHSNILKIWYALEKHLERYPEHRHIFTGFQSSIQNDKPLLAKGSSEPLEGPSLFAHYFHGRDGLSEISNRHPGLSPHPEWSTQYLQPTETYATDVTLDILRRYPPRTVTYVALGPLTNLAKVLRKDGKYFGERINRVIIMGGALDVPGNVTPVAEFNFYADPFAVYEVLVSKHLPSERVFILPLDLTNRHVLSFLEYKGRVDLTFENTSEPSKAEEKSPLVHFTSSILEMTREIMLRYGIDAVELHDPAAMWFAIANPPILEQSDPGKDQVHLQHGWSVCKRVFQVERHGEYTRGMLVVDRRSDDSNYQPNDNREQVQSLPSTLDPTNDSETVHDMLSGVIRDVNVVVKSPGERILVDMVFQRIFSIQ